MQFRRSPEQSLFELLPGNDNPEHALHAVFRADPVVIFVDVIYVKIEDVRKAVQKLVLLAKRFPALE